MEWQGYVSGLHKKDDTYLYVSEGAVGWGPRMRLLSTTEYTLIVLRSPEVVKAGASSFVCYHAHWKRNPPLPLRRSQLVKR